ncbi:MAG: hypothetical protein D6815_06950 [Candidatus Dadabacteria bacterium]|nr:MAG: hypothetical protein D6815_06950 [Candidatus Dadabacteria bacterium]
MAYIRHIPPSRASGRLAYVYREIRAEVARIPNLMQVFSLRPDTMQSVFHTWMASMWRGTVERKLKELVAVVVSKVTNCDYCADAHMVFLQAAGMDRAKAYEIERRLADARSLDTRERTTVAFAARLSRDPRAVGEADVLELAKAWPEREQLVEIVSVMAAFNAITRIANALGVPHEIPAPLRRFEAGRRGAITLLSRLTAISVDLSERPVPGRSPEEVFAAFERLFLQHLGFAELPPGCRHLESCPEIFDGHLRTIEKAVCVLPRDRFVRVGLVVGKLTGSAYFTEECSRWLAERGADAAEIIAASEGAGAGLPDAEKLCLRFARDLTLHSHTIGAHRIDELRSVGLSDGAILDLAFASGVVNGIVRLIAALAPLERD